MPYDALDNLLSVGQKGNTGTNILPRSFEDDSLKRLRKANNPEKGVSRYSYDSNGNLTQRVEGDGTTDSTTVGLGYDALNRLVSKMYPDTTVTPNAVWCYDGQTYAPGTGTCSGSAVTASAGKMTGYGSANSSMKYEHDSVGRVSASEQRTPPGALPYRFVYSFYANDSAATLTYPSQRAVTNCYDGLGRAIWVSKTHTSADCVSGAAVGTSEAYASGIAYVPHGAIKQWQLGSGLLEQTCFNARLQPVGLRVGSGATAGTNTNCPNAGADLLNLSYDYYGSSGQNNGNPLGQTISRPNGFMAYQYYGYDGINRLASVNEYGATATPPAAPCTDSNARWCEGYGFDAVGNRTIGARMHLTQSAQEPLAFASLTNQMTAGALGGTFGYDGRGNLKQNAQGAPTAATFGYDTENRQVAYCAQGGTCTVSTTGAIVYTYDAAGLRVGKSTGVTYVHDAQGELAAEYGGTTDGTAIQYLSADTLGSVRLITDGSGNALACKDYYPFGGEIAATGTNGRSGACWSDVQETLRFTGKERDAETGLDFFGVRYFSGAQGRFTTPDKPFADQHLENPQSWNLYTYTLNNPLRYVDPDGEGVLEGVFRWVDRTGGAFVSLVLEPEKTVPQAAGNVWSAVTHPGQTFSNIGTGVQNFWNSSADDKVTTLTGVVLDVGVAALTGGASRATEVPTTLSELPALANAQNAMEATAAVTSSKTATVVGAYDVKTGAVAVGKSGEGLNPVNPQIAAAAQKAGGLGARNPGVPGAVGNCAECSAANKLANQGSNVNDVRFTQATRPRTGEAVKKCQNCEVMFPKQ